jgi:hypothetical protein
MKATQWICFDKVWDADGNAPDDYRSADNRYRAGITYYKDGWVAYHVAYYSWYDRKHKFAQSPWPSRGDGNNTPAIQDEDPRPATNNETPPVRDDSI